jgi:hypothetical protein
MEPDFIVIRDPNYDELDGRWVDRRQSNPLLCCTPANDGSMNVLYVPTDEFETRQDGAVAQVYVRSAK